MKSIGPYGFVVIQGSRRRLKLHQSTNGRVCPLYDIFQSNPPLLGVKFGPSKPTYWYVIPDSFPLQQTLFNQVKDGPPTASPPYWKGQFYNGYVRNLYYCYII